MFFNCYETYVWNFKILPVSLFGVFFRWINYKFIAYQTYVEKYILSNQTLLKYFFPKILNHGNGLCLVNDFILSRGSQFQPWSNTYNLVITISKWTIDIKKDFDLSTVILIKHLQPSDNNKQMNFWHKKGFWPCLILSKTYSNIEILTVMTDFWKLLRFLNILTVLDTSRFKTNLITMILMIIWSVITLSSFQCKFWLVSMPKNICGNRLML